MVRTLGAATLAFLVLLGSSCSSVPRHPRQAQGFFDVLENLNRSGHSRRIRPSEDAVISEKDVQMVGEKTQTWTWPLKNPKVTSRFGARGDDFHEGIDLKADVGTPVYAAASGKVLYSASKIRGYGKMIVVSHPGGMYSVYAHLSKFHVKPGMQVKRGQLLARSGATGRVSGPHLHFEIRQGTLAYDPGRLIHHLPGQGPSVKSEKNRMIATRRLKRRHS